MSTGARAARLVGLLLAALVSVALLACTSARADGAPATVPPAPWQGFEIDRVNLRIGPNALQVDTDIRFDLSKSALEALHNGVPLTVFVDARLERERLLLNEDISRSTLSYRIEIHPLSQLYVVTQTAKQSNSARPIVSSQTYADYDAMRAGIDRIRALTLFSDGGLVGGESYWVKLKATLSIESLPLPLRPVAYLSDDWSHSSGWRAVRVK